nr:sensor histidine kinase [Propionibacteriales bacterium]
MKWSTATPRHQSPRSEGAAATARRPRWTRPVIQFVAAGLVALIVLIVGSGWLSERAATAEAIADARATTRLLAKSVVEPALTRSLVGGNINSLDRFDRLARQRLIVADVLRVKMWDQSGRIVYSDQTKLIGKRFDLDSEERKVLVDGGTDAEVSDLAQPENQYEKHFGRLLEVYTQVRVHHRQRLLFEAYYSYDDVARRSAEVLSSFRPITVAGLLIFVALTVPLVWVLARRLDAAAAERERLLLAAVEASEGERRRIARDLHDGVVQDLAGISFGASAMAHELGDRPDVAQRLASLATGVRHSLRALRSLLVEIYPPDLRTEGLAAALDDLVAPAIAAGIRVDLQVSDTDGVREEATALVWRVAQETVRNAVRHGRPTSIGIDVTISGDRLVLEVVDDGAGFDPSSVPHGDHLGLRGLRDLILESGGTLDIESAPGSGATIRLEVLR